MLLFLSVLCRAEEVNDRHACGVVTLELCDRDCGVFLYPNFHDHLDQIVCLVFFGDSVVGVNQKGDSVGPWFRKPEEINSRSAKLKLAFRDEIQCVHSLVLIEGEDDTIIQVYAKLKYVCFDDPMSDPTCRCPPVSGLPVRVPDHLGFLHGDHAATTGALEEIVDHRNEVADLLFCIDDFDNQWEVLGETQDLRCMQPAAGAKALDAPQHRCTCKAGIFCPENEQFIQWLSLKAVTLAEKDTQQFSISFQLHVVGP